jgi:hypothetical protein
MPPQEPLGLERRCATGENDAPAPVVYVDKHLDRDLEAPTSEPALGDDQGLWTPVLVSFPSIEDPDGSVECVDEVVDHAVEHVRRSWPERECHGSTVPHGRREVDAFVSASRPRPRCSRRGFAAAALPCRQRTDGVATVLPCGHRDSDAGCSPV